MKNSKKMFLQSVLVLCLCVAMLIGSTFAWFTDNLTSRDNVITSGNLDLEMYWTDDLDSGEWYNVEDDEHNTIFNYDNWEPGYTDVKYIKLVNAGELALNYELSIDPTGEVGKLAEVINVYYANDGVAVEKREDLANLNAIGLLNSVMKGGSTANGTLLGVGQRSPLHKSEEVIVTLAMSMITTAGNEYQNESIGDGFTITALATQAPFEEDSFGKDYDENAEYPEIIKPSEGSVSVNPVDGKVPVGGVTISGGGVSAIVPEGVKLEDGADKLTLKVTPLEHTTSDITVVNGEILIPVDVHIEGVAEDNTVPIIIDLGAVLPKYLNMGNYTLIHVEDSGNKLMTCIAQDEDLTAHNQFKYDSDTGAVTVAMASFSEVALVADTGNPWNGDYNQVDTEFNGAGTEEEPYLITNADELAGLSELVSCDEDDEVESNDWGSKHYKLTSDINIDGKNGNIFYPIGYRKVGDGLNSAGETWYEYGGAFTGTFDGAGHTIIGIYQNTWAMDGNYDAGYYKAAMGLFGYVYGGTIKNLTIDNFNSEGEFAPTGCVTAYGGGNATFSNIAITSSHPQTYNTGVAGIVGWDTDENSVYTFSNITIDASNTISALWGSWDVAAAGLLGYLDGTSKANLDNCHVSATIDVYNDVCGNYQYYWYRYSGMMIGTVDKTRADGSLDLSNITATNCSVNFGDRHEYYYCEFVKNSLASYTHDHQFSRVDHSELNFETNPVTCTHDHKASGYETTDIDGDGKVDSDILKEDKQAVYIPYRQLFGGYGWGVDGVDIGEYEGIDISVIEFSEEKFAAKSFDFSQVKVGTEIKVGDIFKAIDDADINSATVQVAVTDLTNTGITATYKANASDWTKGTLIFDKIDGIVKITIQDYKFCKPTSIKVTVGTFNTTERFAFKFPNVDSYLYRVGNMNEIKISSLFGSKNDDVIADIGDVSVSVTDVNDNTLEVYTAGTGEWDSGTIKFADKYTGPVEVTISDDNYSTPVTLNLEVITAKNITKAESATSNDVVLLNDISGTFTVSNGCTFYGNGFAVKLPTTSVQNVGNGFTGYISIGATQDDGIANGGNLDNVCIEGPVYPEMYIYRDQAKITDKSDADYGDGYNMRYFKNSVIVYGGNCKISNSYISGSRTALCLRGGNNVVVENTTLSGGSYANMQICAGSSVTLRNLTTVQTDVADSYGKGKKAHGLGIAVDSSVVDVYIEGELNQHNWLCEKQWNNIVPSGYQSSFPKFFTNSTFSKYWHYLNGGTEPYVNMAFIYACNWDTSKIRDNRATVDYDTCDATIAGVSGGVYSKVNKVGGNAITDTNLADPGYTSSGFSPVAPVLNFDNTANNDANDENDITDTYCVYDEASGVLKIGTSGDSKTLDLSGVSVTKNGSVLTHTAYLNGTQISGKSVTIKSTDGAKQTLTFKATSNDVGYDKDGNPIEGTLEYTWTVKVEIAVLAYPAPVWNMGGIYKFNTSNCVYAYYSTSQGYGEAVPIYEGVKINYYNKSGEKVELDLSGTTTLPTGSNNSNANAFTYTLSDGSTLTMKYSSGWKSGATTHQFTTYNNKAYIYPQSLDNDNYVRAKTTNQDFDVKITYMFTDPNGQSTEAVTMNWYNAKASNGSVSTVQWKTFDSTKGKKPSVCVTPDTLVTLADGSKKEIQYVSLGEEVQAWNFETGEYVTVPVSLIQAHNTGYMNVLQLYFEDGTTIKILGEHGVFDATQNTFVFIDEYDVEEYIGHYFVKQDGDSYKTVQLVDYEVYEEYTTAYTILSMTHYNVLLEDLFTVTPAHVGDNFFNPFEIFEGMKYDKAAMQADIEIYGLFTYEEFAHVLTEEQFNALNIAQFKVSVCKELVTYDGLIYLIENFVNNENFNQ